MVEKKKEEKVEYYVDFESWYFMAENEEEALKQAEAKLNKGDIPAVVLVDCA